MATVMKNLARKRKTPVMGSRNIRNLPTLVAAGELTQEEADEILKRFNEQQKRKNK